MVRIYQYTVERTSDESKKNYQLEDVVMYHQIFRTNVRRNVRKSVKRINILILELIESVSVWSLLGSRRITSVSGLLDFSVLIL